MSTHYGPGDVSYAITCDHKEYGQYIIQFPVFEKPGNLPKGFHVSKLVAGIITEVDGRPV